MLGSAGGFDDGFSARISRRGGELSANGSGEDVISPTGLGSRPDLGLGSAPIGRAGTALVDPEASRVDRYEIKIGLLKSSWFTPTGADSGRMLSPVDCADGGILT